MSGFVVVRIGGDVWASGTAVDGVSVCAAVQPRGYHGGLREVRRRSVMTAEEGDGSRNGTSGAARKPLPKRGAGSNDGKQEPHPSWGIYEEPGNKCVICYGKGYEKCLFCFGDGYVLVGPQASRDTETCPICKGEKKTLCVRCKGSGVRPSTRYDFETGTMVRNPTNREISLGLDTADDPAQSQTPEVDESSTDSDPSPATVP